MTQTFIKNGHILIINKDFDESYEVYLERAWLIINTYTKENNKYAINDLINLSRVWRNVKYLGCSYSDKVTSKLSSCFGQI